MDRKNNIGFRRGSSLLALSSMLSALSSSLIVLSSILLAFFTLLFALSSSLVAEAADKLVVKDAAGSSDVFKVGDNGNVAVSGTDSNNSYQLKLMGHTGGNSHIQLVTDQLNSRITLMAGDKMDYAPRLQLMSSQSLWAGQPANQGWGLFDYGSNLYDLPGAQFLIRHYNTSGPIAMMQFVGRDKVIFPSSNVGIGTTDPIGKLDVNGDLYVSGSIYQRGSLLHADYVFEPNYKMETIEEHAQYMWENKHLSGVPGVHKDENGQEIIEVGSHQRGILEELEKAHVYIERLNEKIKALETKLKVLEANINK